MKSEAQLRELYEAAGQARALPRIRRSSAAQRRMLRNACLPPRLTRRRAGPRV
jgi:hypothetical protein